MVAKRMGIVVPDLVDVVPDGFSEVAAFLGCGTRDECRQNSERFNRMEADLHNLWPSRADINQARSNYRFAMIEGELREFGECDFERDTISRLADYAPGS